MNLGAIAAADPDGDGVLTPEAAGPKATKGPAPAKSAAGGGTGGGTTKSGDPHAGHVKPGTK